MKTPVNIAPAQGKLGILLVGLGAVSTTTIAGVIAIRKGLAQPIGSLTQMGTIRLGKRTDEPVPEDQRVRAARQPRRHRLRRLGHLRRGLLRRGLHGRRARALAARSIRAELEAIKPMPAVFDQRYVKRLSGPNVKKGKNKKDLADQLIADIRNFKEKHNCVAAGDGVVRQHRGLHEGRPGAPVAGRLREGPRAERRRDSVEHGLRLRGVEGRPAVRERRAEPHRRHSGDARARRADQGAARRQRHEDRADADQDDHRARASRRA